jgi:hypothetical protein
LEPVLGSLILKILKQVPIAQIWGVNPPIFHLENFFISEQNAQIKKLNEIENQTIEYP